MISARPVNQANGTSANGMPMDSNTWLSTSAQVGSTPSARITSAGTTVTTRRTITGT